MSPRAWVARALLDLSGHVGALGPVLAAACARAADLLTAAAERVAPLVECPGCGAAVPSLDLEVVGVCGPCSEREAAGPLVGVTLPDAYADARINVPPERSAKPN